MYPLPLFGVIEMYSMVRLQDQKYNEILLLILCLILMQISIQIGSLWMSFPIICISMAATILMLILPVIEESVNSQAANRANWKMTRMILLFSLLKYGIQYM
jgi:hypothetical protein